MGDPATLFAIITATAPASWAFSTFAVKLQLPRSINAILPTTCTALVSVSQPSFAGDVPSVTKTTSAVIGVAGNPGPKVASVELYGPAIPAGELTSKKLPREVPPVQRYICMRGLNPSSGVPKLALFVPLPSCASASTKSSSAPPFP